jgi:hypothetical protein
VLDKSPVKVSPRYLTSFLGELHIVYMNQGGLFLFV